MRRTAKAKQIKSAFGRTISDPVFAARLGDDPLRFEENEFGWWIFYGATGKYVLCNGPNASLPFGRETFRRLTGRDLMVEKKP